VRARAILILVTVLTPLPLPAQSPDDPSPPAAVPLNNDRILGVIPNFQTVNDPRKPYVPLRVRDKWILFVKETVDPYTFFSAAAGAGVSQWKNDDPKYGNGFKPYMQRFGAAQADIAAQNFFSDALLASLFHEDPRYFRKGPTSPVLRRVVYSLSRSVITRRDSGRESINCSGILGMGMGIVLSNAYYPPKSVSSGEMESRLLTSMAASALGNLLPEFWPDIKGKLSHFRHNQSDPVTESSLPAAPIPEKRSSLPGRDP
jgi:hypothetical protein